MSFQASFRGQVPEKPQESEAAKWSEAGHKAVRARKARIQGELISILSIRHNAQKTVDHVDPRRIFMVNSPVSRRIPASGTAMSSLPLASRLLEASRFERRS